MCVFKSPKPPAPVVLPAATPAPTPPKPSQPQVIERIITQPAPQVQEPAPAPQAQDYSVQQAKFEERKRRLRQNAANNTLVTGGQGVTASGNTGGKQLYGA